MEDYYQFNEEGRNTIFLFLHVCFSLLLVNKFYQETVRHNPNSSVQTGSKSMRSKTDKKENYMVVAIST